MDNRSIQTMGFCLGHDEVGLIPRLIHKKDPGIFVEIFLIDLLSDTIWKRRLKIFVLRLINAMLRTKNSYAGHSLVHNIAIFLIGVVGRLFKMDTKRKMNVM